MGKKTNKKLSSYLESENLTFTKEDRDATLQKIRHPESKHSKKKIRFVKSVAPLMATLAVIVLVIALLPSLLVNDNQSADPVTKEEYNAFSLLLMGENSSDIQQKPVNILITFNPKKESAKVISLPLDLRVDRYNAKGEKLEKTKLLHVSAYDPKPEASIKTITNYLNVPIDYYATMPTEKIFQQLEADDHLKKESIIHQNKVATLLHENQLFAKLIEKVSNHKTNMTDDALKQIKTKNYQYELVSLDKGLRDIWEEVYYVELEPDFLKQITNELREHLAK